MPTPINFKRGGVVIDPKTGAIERVIDFSGLKEKLIKSLV